MAETKQIVRADGKTTTSPTLETDVLVGMKAICTFLRMSEATVMKWQKEYENFPVKKNGVLISSRHKLNNWFREYLDR